MKIILTDWPKFKHIDANYRGMESEELLKLRKRMFTMMMGVWSDGPVGGWVVNYDYNKIEEELNFRKVKMEKL